MNIPKSVVLCEVGPRDGLQNEKHILTVEEKLELLDALAGAGFKVIEFGSFMSPKAVPQMANSDEVYQKLKKREGVEYRALVANARGVQRAVDCGCKKVKLNISASNYHNLANLNKTTEETMASFQSSFALATENGLAVSGSIACPFGSPWDGEIPIDNVKKIIEAYLKAGVSEISISDAPGMATPGQVYGMMVELQDTFPEVKYILHFHNTRGMAVANIIAGMDAGVTWFDTAFAGVGGCPFVPGAAGNVSSEDVVHMFSEMGVETGIDLDKVIAIGRRVEEIINRRADSYVLHAGKNKDLLKELPTGQLKNQTELKTQ